MNIVHFINSLETKGGAEHLVCEYVEKDGHKVVTLHEIKRSLWRLKDLHSIINLLKSADIIHVHLFPCLYYGFFLKIFFRKNIVFTEHNSWNRRRKFKLIRLIEKFIYRKYDRITCISQGTLDALVDWIGLSENVVLVENGVDLSKSYFKLPKKKQNQRLTLLMIGRFTDQKNQDLLIQYVFDNPETNLILVGDGYRLEQCKKYVEGHNLRDRVTFVAPQPHPITLSDVPDLYIQCSHWEGFGLTVIEAISDGIPAIGSAVPGLGSILDNFISFDNSLKSLSIAIEEFKLQQDYLIRQKKEITKYDFQRHLEKLEKIYINVIH